MKGIDLRQIKDAKDGPNTYETGISFDEEGDFLILRFHYTSKKGNQKEKIMYLGKKERQKVLAYLIGVSLSNGLKNAHK